MKGIFSKLPADTLAAALAPVAKRCEQLDWAVDLYSGPLRYQDWIDESPGSLMSYHRAQEGLPMGWFARGFLPRYADRLIVDEWSCYLGFDSRTLDAAELVRLLGDGRALSARPALFGVVEEHGLLFMLRVARGWWEAYTPDAVLMEQLRLGWDGVWIDSDKWDMSPEHPGGSGAI
jgi:hypothetical protein